MGDTCPCCQVLIWFFRVTAIADKLGVEFALIHKKRDGRSEGAPERMELLVGDVADKVHPLLCLKHRWWLIEWAWTGCYIGRRYD